MAARSSLSSLRASLQQLSRRWPHDVLRTGRADLQFSNAIPSAADRVCREGAGEVQAREKAAGRMLDALRRIYEGKASQEFPTPGRVRRPPSAPEHFDHLLAGVERAQRGESLSWFRRHFRLR